MYRNFNEVEMPQLQVAIPESVENMQLPNPELLMFYKNQQERIIWVDFDIEQDILEVSKQIMYYNILDKDIPVDQRRPIKLLIYSYGGDGQACFSLIDTIKISKTPVYTVNMGVAMSAGFIILLSGHKRYCLKNSVALSHSGSGETKGTYEQTQEQMKNYHRFVQTMREYIIERTKIDKKMLNKYKDKEWYIYAQEQKDLGIVDGIIEDIDEII